MALSIGIVGLPNVGKSTLFNALTNGNVEAANYPFCTIDANEGIVPVVDERVDNLVKMFESKKKTYTAIQFTDIAGLVEGASKGEGLGNKFLSHIREVDAIVQVVRLFEDENITHIGAVDPVRDVEIINTELILRDLESITQRKERLTRQLKAGKSKEAAFELDVLAKCEDHLDNGGLISTLSLTKDETLAIRPLFFLTMKPMLFAGNVGEDDITNPEGNPHYANLEAYAKTLNADVVTFSARIEAELRDLPEDEKRAYLEDYGITESGIDRLARAGYRLLNLITYLTGGPSESRAWTITQGTLAPQAAGVIHTDFERGFISAEVVAYDTLMKTGSYQKAKELGEVRLEGKEYEVKDGDVIIFRFNV